LIAISLIVRLDIVVLQKIVGLNGIIARLRYNLYAMS
jgi:hypothetical protein